MNDKLHLLDSDIEEPLRFTFPFNYTPHPLCVVAAKAVQDYVASVASWREEINEGKMFGVLVVRDAENHLGYLAAFSGLLGGRGDWQYFVPSVYDSQQPDGYFKTHEREISCINERIHDMETDDAFVLLKASVERVKHEAEREIEAFKSVVREAKARRDRLRAERSELTSDECDSMVRESQYQKAELRRIRKRCVERVREAESALSAKLQEIALLKSRRKEMSDSLQHWLFCQYDMLNARGEHKSLCDIFSATPQGVPPSGAGDCCAPKLLQYAYKNNMRPVCMAEFWWGKSPKTEIRHHLHYYPACRSKCKPILGWMLQGLNVDADPHDSRLEGNALRVLYADKDIVVVSKPSGMLSMPGRVGRESVVDALTKTMGSGFYMPAHRLDMDTSGLLVVARTEQALRSLHEQFASRRVRKRYVAVLDGELTTVRHGFVRLPLSADEVDRPRQKVDYESGKPSVTEYKVLRADGGKTYVELIPHTGRTHQLRVHCAHVDGLGVPIVGDKLYGHPTENRLMLHAEYLSFEHPATGRRLEFTDPMS